MENENEEQVEMEQPTPVRKPLTKRDKINFLAFVVLNVAQVIFLIFVFLHTGWMASIAITILWLTVLALQYQLVILQRSINSSFSVAFNQDAMLAENVLTNLQQIKKQSERIDKIADFLNRLTRQPPTNLTIH